MIKDDISVVAVVRCAISCTDRVTWGVDVQDRVDELHVTMNKEIAVPTACISHFDLEFRAFDWESHLVDNNSCHSFATERTTAIFGSPFVDTLETKGVGTSIDSCNILIRVIFLANATIETVGV
mmetsp:Transcript_16004/g.24199  ORF Transcript_16004/g.24199 Transcript_16004/m.24199 type:complete len:124 (-) Transcript_16004:153-524(-)